MSSGIHLRNPKLNIVAATNMTARRNTQQVQLPPKSGESLQQAQQAQQAQEAQEAQQQAQQAQEQAQRKINIQLAKLKEEKKASGQKTPSQPPKRSFFNKNINKNTRKIIKQTFNDVKNMPNNNSTKKQRYKNLYKLLQKNGYTPNNVSKQQYKNVDGIFADPYQNVQDYPKIARELENVAEQAEYEITQEKEKKSGKKMTPLPPPDLPVKAKYTTAQQAQLDRLQNQKKASEQRIASQPQPKRSFFNTKIKKNTRKIIKQTFNDVKNMPNNNSTKKQRYKNLYKLLQKNGYTPNNVSKQQYKNVDGIFADPYQNVQDYPKIARELENVAQEVEQEIAQEKQKARMAKEMEKQKARMAKVNAKVNAAMVKQNAKEKKAILNETTSKTQEILYDYDRDIFIAWKKKGISNEYFSGDSILAATESLMIGTNPVKKGNALPVLYEYNDSSKINLMNATNSDRFIVQYKDGFKTKYSEGRTEEEAKKAAQRYKTNKIDIPVDIRNAQPIKFDGKNNTYTVTRIIDGKPIPFTDRNLEDAIMRLKNQDLDYNQLILQYKTSKNQNTRKRICRYKKSTFGKPIINTRHLTDTTMINDCERLRNYTSKISQNKNMINVLNKSNGKNLDRVIKTLKNKGYTIKNVKNTPYKNMYPNLERASKSETINTSKISNGALPILYNNDTKKYIFQIKMGMLEKKYFQGDTIENAVKELQKIRQSGYKYIPIDIGKAFEILHNCKNYYIRYKD